MDYDLRNEAWIPFQRRSGRVDWGPPSTLVDGIASDDPVVAIGSGRADFDGALCEFLIGLLAVVMAPRSDEEWLACYNDPPTVADLDRLFRALPDAFNLVGPGPRFLQDFTVEAFANEEPGPIEQLLIEAAGDQTIGNNADLFTKRERYAALSPQAATMTILTLQTYAPSGGKGHRTSMRGGGPLTTLADPRRGDDEAELSPEQQPLWQLLWANVPSCDRSDLATTEATKLFPWLAPTRTSEKDRATTTSDAHRLQAFFAMPRRVRLDVAYAGTCALLGVEAPFTIVGYRARPYGVKYEGWYHPLSPYYLSSGQWLPVHGQPGGIGWRDWYGYALNGGSEDTRIADCVREFGVRRARLLGSREFTVRAFGYDMDNMKARSWIAGAMPCFAVSDESKELIAETARNCTALVDLLSSLLNGCIRRSLFPSEDAKPDVTAWRAALWGGTEQKFYVCIRELGRAEDISDKARADLLRRFYNDAATAARVIFANACPTEGVSHDRLRRTVDQRFALEMMMRGHGPMGKKLFGTIGIQPPKSKKASSTTKKTRPVT